MYKAKFIFSDGDEEYEGYTDGSLWNGWASVYMTKEQAKKLWDSTPYDYRFSGEGVYEKLIVYIDSSGNDVFYYVPILTDEDEILHGFAIEGYEFVEVKPNE